MTLTSYSEQVKKKLSDELMEIILILISPAKEVVLLPQFVRTHVFS